MLVQRPSVEQHEVFAGFPHAHQLLGSDPRRAVLVLHQLAEQLAGHVDALEQRVARRLPGRRSARDPTHGRVAEPSQQPCGTLGDTVAAVDQQHADGTARNQSGNARLQPAIGARYGKERMAFAEFAGFAQIEKSDLAPIVNERLGIGCRERAAHSAGGSGSRPAKNALNAARIRSGRCSAG